MLVEPKIKEVFMSEKANLFSLSGSEERYVETIHSLIKEHGYARPADIAIALNVKPPSVTSMLQRLDGEKFAKYTRYRGVILTKKGKMLAEALEKRHQTLRSFLEMIGVSEQNADKDACEIEHKINLETVQKLSKFVDFIQSAPETPRFLRHFEYFSKVGNRPTDCRMTKTARTNDANNETRA